MGAVALAPILVFLVRIQAQEFIESRRIEL